MPDKKKDQALSSFLIISQRAQSLKNSGDPRPLLDLIRQATLEYTDGKL